MDSLERKTDFINASRKSLKLLSDAVHRISSIPENGFTASPQLTLYPQPALKPLPQLEYQSSEVYGRTASAILPGESIRMSESVNERHDILKVSNILSDDSILLRDMFSNSGTEVPPSLLPYSSLSVSQQMPPRRNAQWDRSSNFDPCSSVTEPETLDSLAVNCLPSPRESRNSSPKWSVSALGYCTIKEKLNQFSAVIPEDFILPSRYTLSRYLEGYTDGFHKHLPFLHIPTVSVVDLEPELLLAIITVGAQYRFEGHKGNRMWFTARAIAKEQIRRRSDDGIVADSLRNSSSDSVSPDSNAMEDRTPSQNYDLQMDSASEIETEKTNNSSQARLSTVQALLLLMATGTWGPRALLHESLCLRSLLALLVHDEDLYSIKNSHEEDTWEKWIEVESRKRTIFVSYSLFNLQCVAFDLPPLILSVQLQRLSLPQSTEQWEAQNAWKWREIRRASTPVETPFYEALTDIFHRYGGGLTKTPKLPISSLGNYILMTALIQHIFFARQNSLMDVPRAPNKGLQTFDLDQLSQALRVWQADWESTLESTSDPSCYRGPVAFNSTVLFQLACIRLHSDLGPCRKLESHDPHAIASALMSSPSLTRSTRLSAAVLQAAHALSIPIKIGIAFVARAQTLSWSVQYSLFSLESAFLLSTLIYQNSSQVLKAVTGKWLETVASSPLELSEEEEMLLDMVNSMVNETNLTFMRDGRDDSDEAKKPASIRKLAAAVVWVWAETFKGSHIFEIVKIIGESLKYYAKLLDKANQQLDD